MKTAIPYDRSGDPAEGCSIIKISAYGNTESEAQENHNRMKNESRMQGQPVSGKSGNRWCVTWHEDMKIADVIPFKGGWRGNKKGKK